MADKPTVKIKVADKNSETKDRITDTENASPIKPEAAEEDKAPESVEDLKKKIADLEQASSENYDRFLRISAEFENYKKRAAREAQDFKKFANESLLKALLPVVDNLELALRSAESNNAAEEKIAEGIELTLKEILSTLEKFGVEQIDCLEQPFDPTYHQAVMQEEADDHAENVVLRELQKGYLYNERLLRPSMVVVSKPKDQTLTSREKGDSLM